MKRSIIVLVTLLLGVAGVFAQRTGGQGQAPPVALHKDRAPNNRPRSPSKRRWKRPRRSCRSPRRCCGPLEVGVIARDRGWWSRARPQNS